MLTKKDLVLIGEVINQTVPAIIEKIVEPKFEEFAILMQNEFRAIHETKADKNDILKLQNDISNLDNKVTRLENKFEGRIERLEDNMRIVKTTLKLT